MSALTWLGEHWQACVLAWITLLMGALGMVARGAREDRRRVDVLRRRAGRAA